MKLRIRASQNAPSPASSEATISDSDPEPDPESAKPKLEQQEQEQQNLPYPPISLPPVQRLSFPPPHIQLPPSQRALKKQKVNPECDVATVSTVDGRVCGFRKGNRFVCDLQHDIRLCPESVDRIINDATSMHERHCQQVSDICVVGNNQGPIVNKFGNVQTLVEGDKVKRSLRKSWAKTRKKEIFQETDVLSCYGAQNLLGKRVRVYWQNDRMWYAGTVSKLAWVPAAKGNREYMKCKHLIAYDDGQKEELFLAEERVSIQLEMFTEQVSGHPGTENNCPQEEFLRVNGQRLLKCRKRKNGINLHRRGRRYLRIAMEGQPLYSQGQLLWMKRKGVVVPSVVMGWDHIDPMLEQNMFHQSVPLAVFGSGEYLLVSIEEVFEELPDVDFVDGEALKQLMDLLDFGHLPVWLNHGCPSFNTPKTLRVERHVPELDASVLIPPLESEREGGGEEDDEQETESDSDVGGSTGVKMFSDIIDDQQQYTDSSDQEQGDQDKEDSLEYILRGTSRGTAHILPRSLLSNKTPAKGKGTKRRRGQGRGRGSPRPKKEKIRGNVPEFEDLEKGTLKRPFKISAKCAVHNFGVIDYIHPLFHTERQIFPVGLHIKHVSHLPWSEEKDETVEYNCKILKGKDGLPLFKLDLGENRVVEGANFRALQKNIQVNYSPGKPIFGAFVDWIFGFQSQGLRKAIQNLPNAAYCENFRGWLGPPPPKPEISENLIQMRRVAYAKMQKIPEGVKPQPYRSPQTVDGHHRCHICGHLEFEDDLFLECDRCRIVVHMSCYGVKERPDGQLWLCDVCKMRMDRPQPCLLCPILGGPMKITKDNNWCHIVCALWVPEVSFGDVDLKEPILGAEKCSKKKAKCRCSICKQQSGCLLQCAFQKCSSSHHPQCARIEGLIMEFDEVHPEQVKKRRQSMEKVPVQNCAIQISTVQQQNGVNNNQQNGIIQQQQNSIEQNGSMSQQQQHVQIRFVSYCRKHTKQRQQNNEKFFVLQNHSTTEATNDSKNDDEIQQQLQLGGCSKCTYIQTLQLLDKKIPKVVRHVGIVDHSDLKQRQRMQEFQLQIELEKLQLKQQKTPKQQQRHQLVNQEEIYQSTFERFYEMRATLSERVGFGKSSIHCWGGFAKKPHKQGDMIIEYVGEIIRPAVADNRERELYNEKFGGGTYIFRMNAQKCVDATLTGNIAGLLNHSCNPNCYSKTITIKHPYSEETEDHVLIVAKRDILENEELTYDYRYAGEQSLSCNCQAEKCRQVVNFQDREHEILAPRSQLVSAADEIDTSRVPLYEQFNFYLS